MSVGTCARQNVIKMLKIMTANDIGRRVKINDYHLIGMVIKNKFKIKS